MLILELRPESFWDTNYKLRSRYLIYLDNITNLTPYFSVTQ